jgi:O-antigen ligase
VMLAGRPRTRRVYWQVPAALLLAATVATLLNPYGDPSFMLYRPAGAYADANGASSGRLEYWWAALQVAMDRPWLGSGAGSCWWLVQGPDVNHVQPHNALIQFFLSWGLVPTMALVALLADAALRVHRIARRVPAVVPLVMMLDALLAMSMVDGMLYFARFLMLVSALFAICLASNAALSSRASNARLRSAP